MLQYAAYLRKNTAILYQVKESIMRRIFETAVILIGTLGWWGFVYPELCMTEGTYEVAVEGNEIPEEENLSMEYRDIDDFFAGKGNIRIKSKAIEYLCQVKEKRNDKKDESND